MRQRNKTKMTNKYPNDPDADGYEVSKEGLIGVPLKCVISKSLA